MVKGKYSFLSQNVQLADKYIPKKWKIQNLVPENVKSKTNISGY